jgi:hypothetical protein
METKKLISCFTFLLVVMFFISCNNKTINDKVTPNIYDGITTVEIDNGVMFIDSLEINNIIYIRQTISDYDLSYNVIRFINNEDTIEFEKDALFVRDSIYDTNNDYKDDLNITYQATRGFITYSFYFNIENNRLSTIPDTLINSNIDDY